MNRNVEKALVEAVDNQIRNAVAGVFILFLASCEWKEENQTK